MNFSELLVAKNFSELLVGKKTSTLKPISLISDIWTNYVHTYIKDEKNNIFFPFENMDK